MTGHVTSYRTNKQWPFHDGQLRSRPDEGPRPDTFTLKKSQSLKVKSFEDGLQELEVDEEPEEEDGSSPGSERELRFRRTMHDCMGALFKADRP